MTSPGSGLSIFWHETQTNRQFKLSSIELCVVIVSTIRHFNSVGPPNFSIFDVKFGNKHLSLSAIIWTMQ